LDSVQQPITVLDNLLVPNATRHRALKATAHIKKTTRRQISQRVVRVDPDGFNDASDRIDLARQAPAVD
jgi:hypothetical protein